MKIVIAFLSLTAIVGIVYGLAFFGIIPVQKMADKSPGLASVLTKLHLAKPQKAKPMALAATSPNPAEAALDAQKKQLAADRAKFDKDRADWEAQKQTPAAASDSATSNSASAAMDATTAAATDNAAKLTAIYAAMSPDDLARIFGKLPDPDVIQSLTQLDEKKAGQILAILPADRAARIARQMSHSTPPARPQMQAAL